VAAIVTVMTAACGGSNPGHAVAGGTEESSVVTSTPTSEGTALPRCTATVLAADRAAPVVRARVPAEAHRR
jgi:hypothetical protein